jgi:aspartate carbamoyltransferase catalytic subunit
MIRLEDIKQDGWPHIIRAQQFSRKWIETVLFPLTDIMEKLSVSQKKKLLRYMEVISLFVAESTRTRASFEIAAHRLGAEIIFGSEAANKFSSLAKGESLEDMIMTLAEYGTNAFILRSANEGDAEKAASVTHIPVINAGDGKGQHPTQALLDIRTINKYFPNINGITVAFIGDIVGSRTIHSLAYILGRYTNVKIYFVAPEYMEIKPEILDYLKRHEVQVYREKDIRNIASLVDVFYVTRTQGNLGTPSWDRTDEKQGFTIINKQVMDLAKPDAIVMHPLPCCGEIVRSEVDDDPRAVYLKTRGDRMSQVRCGLFVRQTLLLTVMAPETCVKLLNS